MPRPAHITELSVHLHDDDDDEEVQWWEYIERCHDVLYTWGCVVWRRETSPPSKNPLRATCWAVEWSASIGVRCSLSTPHQSSIEHHTAIWQRAHSNWVVSGGAHTHPHTHTQTRKPFHDSTFFWYVWNLSLFLPTSLLSKHKGGGSVWLWITDRPKKKKKHTHTTHNTHFDQENCETKNKMQKGITIGSLCFLLFCVFLIAVPVRSAKRFTIMHVTDGAPKHPLFYFARVGRHWGYLILLMHRSARLGVWTSSQSWAQCRLWRFCQSGWAYAAQRRRKRRRVPSLWFWGPDWGICLF